MILINFFDKSARAKNVITCVYANSLCYISLECMSGCNFYFGENNTPSFKVDAFI